MKVCFLGNSHLYALKAAIKGGYTPSFEADFFGATSTALKSLRISEGRLHGVGDSLPEKLKRLSGVTEYDLNLADVIVVVGGQMWVTSAFALFKNYRPWEFHNGSTELISEDAFEAAVLDMHATSVAVHLLKLICSLGKKVIVVPAPLLNEIVIQEKTFPFLESPDAKRYIAWLVRISTRVWEQISQKYRAELLVQGHDTLTECGLTSVSFAAAKSLVDGVWIDKPDPVHANGLFGATVFEAVRKRLQV